MTSWNSLALFAFTAVYQASCYFEAEMTETRVVSGTNEADTAGIKLKRLNKTTYALTGPMKINSLLDDSFQVKINLYKKQGNEFRLTPFHIGPHDFCDYVMNKGTLYDYIRDCSDFPERSNCPWNPAIYTLNRCLIPMDMIPKFFDGDYRADILIEKSGTVVTGYQIFFYVINFG